MDCACRELHEESSILVDNNSFENYYEQKSTKKNIGIWMVQFQDYPSITIEEKEIYSYEWLTIDEDTMWSYPISKNQSNIYYNVIECLTPLLNYIKNTKTD